MADPLTIGVLTASALAMAGEAALKGAVGEAAKVERRIRASTKSKLIDSESTAHTDGRWLTPEVAGAALAFFQRSADLLPSEPYIYSSQQGDVVAEFGSKNGTLTSVISSDLVILFASVAGTPVERTLRPYEVSNTTIRSVVRDFTEMLRKGHHGTVVTGR
jgi:hypothetical protein